MTLEELFNEILEKYETSRRKNIWEYSVNIGLDLSGLDEEIKCYKKQFKELIQKEVRNNGL